MNPGGDGDAVIDGFRLGRIPLRDVRVGFCAFERRG
jgi:hypothetical protein